MKQELQFTTLLDTITIAKEAHPRTKFGKEARQSTDTKLLSNFKVDIYILIHLKNKKEQKRPCQNHYHFFSAAIMKGWMKLYIY